MGKKINISKEEFRNLYENKKLTTFQIANYYGCCQATIWKKLKEFGIKARLPGIKRVKITKKELKNLYLNKNLSTWKIESKLNIPRGTIHRKLKEFGIKTRDLATANNKYPKNNFSGNKIEKAYMIGFRIGDLRVRKQHKNSRTICVACSSTIPEQIQLIKELFKKYGRVWIKKSANGITHTEAYLNESFDFLLTKNVPKEIFDNKDDFFSFLAGFIDAEGHIGVYRKMAKFTIGNYDSKLLKKISKNLTRYGIICKKPTSDNRKGKLNSSGYKYNNNYCTLRIYNKENLSKLFKEILPFIKHRNKLKSLNIAINNVNQRMKRKMKNEKTFYITTPIYYANGNPHAGSAYTTIAADVLVRWHKLLGEECFFLTGTDEHGLKIQEAAKKAKKEPKKFVDEISKNFKELFKKLNISNDNFIRTTNKKHEKEVKGVLQELYDRDFIYKGNYEAHYCVGCEQNLTKSDLVDGKCPLHNKEPELRKEEAYLFKLSSFQDKLLKLIKNETLCILPKKRRNEVIKFIETGLKDISISRKKEKVHWGIELPFDKEHTCFVWVDAFWNYITGIKEKNAFDKFWPVDVQLMANDIIRVHSTIWPALLLALDYEIPKTIFVHGYFTVNGKKMSKTLGNVIDPMEWAKKYPVDSIRYFFMRHIAFGQDGDISEQALINRHNDELANKLGNLVSRVSGLIEKKGIEKYTSSKQSLKEDILDEKEFKKIERLFNNYEFDKVLNEIFACIDTCNCYLQQKKPWEDNLENPKQILYEVADSIKTLAILLSPFIPETSEKIAKQFGFKISIEELDKPLKTIKIKKGEILFKKI